MQLTRNQDWPERLAEQVAAAQVKPYVIGVHDCLRFSCQCIESMTGVDLWPQFAGYTTRREAVALQKKYGPSLCVAFANAAGLCLSPVLSARRGDVVTYRDKYGEHLGVCTGTHVAVLGHAGLLFVRLDHSGLGSCIKVG